MKILTTIALGAVVISGTTYGARPIPGLSAGAAELFNQCVDQHCERKIDPDTKEITESCPGAENLPTCCNRALVACGASCLLEGCENACNQAEGHCKVGRYVTTYFESGEEADHPKADAPTDVTGGAPEAKDRDNE